MIDRKDKRFFDFMCSCKDEGVERCERVYDEVMASLNEKRTTTDKTFLDHIVIGLDYMENGSANIDHIYTDMWSGIGITYQYDYDEDRCECGKGADHDECECSEYKTQNFWVECDQVHHGLARAYQLVKAFDEGVEGAGR
jgi:hypothetical protein